MSYKLGIIGSSSFRDYDFFEKTLKELKKQPSTIVSGNCRGTEALAENFAMRKGIKFEKINYENIDGGRFALNKAIIDKSNALIVFWDSMSTSGIQAINRAIYKELQVKVVPVAEADRDVKTKNDIGFQGNRRWLSNMWPCEIKIGAVTFRSSEAAYQAFKVRKNKNLVDQLAKMPAITTKKKIKEWQSFYSDFDKIKAMETVIRAKFKQNPYLLTKLLLTGDEELVEINNWNDIFWGVCDGVGENNLGKILMFVRAELKKI